MKQISMYFKSDFTVILASEAQWGGCPFRIKLWTASPAEGRSIKACFDGEVWHNCRLLDDGRLLISVNQADLGEKQYMGIGTLKMDIEFYLSNQDFNDHYCNEHVKTFEPVFEDEDGEQYHLYLDNQGASTITTIGTLPAYYQAGLTPEEHQALINETNAAHDAASLANKAAGKAKDQTEASKKHMADVNADYTKLKGDLQKAYADTTAALTKDYTDKKAALDADYAQEKKALTDDYVATKNALGKDYADTKTSIAAEYAQKQTALAAEYQAKQEALAADYARDLKALNDRMTAIESQYATDKAAWQKQTTDFIAECRSTFTTNEAARQKSASDQRNAEKQTFDAQIASQDAEFQRKEETRDAANQAALDAAETMANHEQRIANNEVAIKELQSLFGNGVEGYVRVSGVSDPAFNYRSYKHEVGAESVFDCLKPCLVGNNFTGRVGEILHVLNPLNWYETEDGRTVKLDATEGEVMVCPTKPMYGISGHVTFGTVTYDVFLRSFVPFEWHGHPAEKIAPVGWSPSYTVAHKDDDNVTRMHSCYNPAFEGSYSAQQGIVGAFIQTQNEDGTISEQYDGTAALFGGAGGLHTTNLALYTGEQYAMNLNEDTTKTYPFMNRTAQCEELMFGNMLAEGGTFDAHNLNLMGSGFCSNDAATSAAHWEESNADARNGFRYVKQDGTWGYYSIGSNADFGYGATGDNLCKACMLNSWRSPWKCMEQQRVMIYAISNNIPELTWFAFEGNKYKWRHVDGFEGPSNGAMTCVVWKHFSSKLVQGCVEPGTTKDVSGNRCEFLICSALYRGVITDVSPSWWTSGLLFTQDADGTMYAYVQRDQKLLLKTPSTISRATDAEPWPFENSYVAAGDFANSNAYSKDYNDAALMLPKNRATQTGAGLHTYVGAYKYLAATKPSSGFSLRGFRRGYSANASNLSPLCVLGYSTPSLSNTYFAFGICCEIESRGL